MEITTFNRAITLKEAIDHTETQISKTHQLYHKNERKELSAEDISYLIDNLNRALKIHLDGLQQAFKKL